MSHIEEGTLHAYLDGECRPHERDAIEAHLAVCEECRARLDEARAVTSKASEILDDLEPRPSRRPPWRELEERAAARGRLARKRRWLHPGLGWAASIMLAFGLGWLARTSYLADLEPSLAEIGREGAAADVSEIPVRGRVDELETARGSAIPEQEEAAAGEPKDRAAEPPSGLAAKAEATEPSERSEPPADARADRDAETPDRPAPATTAPAQATKETTAPATASPERARSQVAAAESDEPEPEESARWAEIVTREVQRIAGERREAEPGRGVASLEDSPRAPELRDALTPTGGARTAASDAFFRVAPAEAVRWLGAPLRTLPELELQAVEVGPATAVSDGVTGRPVVRLSYRDAAGTVVTLTQQIAGLVRDTDDIGPTLRVLPSGTRAYRWLDGRGYWLTLSGHLSADSLRALADRVR